MPLIWKRFLAHLPALVVPWLTPLALLVAWQCSVQYGWLSRKILPAPWEVLVAAGRLLHSGELLHHLAISSERAGVGFLIGGSAGFILGMLTGVSPRAARVLDSSLQMLRTIPHLALIPLVILWFGIGETAKVVLVAEGVLFPIYLNTYHGIRSVDPGFVEMGRVYGLSRWALYQRIILPGALPSILVGIRYALGVMWLTLIVAETISASSGIGYLAMNAREFLQTDVVVLSIILYALLGKAADVTARLLESRWLRWHPGYQLKRQHA